MWSIAAAKQDEIGSITAAKQDDIGSITAAKQNDIGSITVVILYDICEHNDFTCYYLRISDSKLYQFDRFMLFHKSFDSAE